jgi:hypothetical protein
LIETQTDSSRKNRHSSAIRLQADAIDLNQCGIDHIDNALRRQAAMSTSFPIPAAVPSER